MLVLALFTALFLQQPPPTASAPVMPAPQARAPDTVETARATIGVINAAPIQVCRMEPVTGSRFGRRVCRSATQTDEDRSNSREMLRRMQGARTPPVG